MRNENNNNNNNNNNSNNNKKKKKKKKKRKNLQRILKFCSVNLILISTRTWLIFVLCPGLVDILGCEEIVRSRTDGPIS